MQPFKHIVISLLSLAPTFATGQATHNIYGQFAPLSNLPFDYSAVKVKLISHFGLREAKVSPDGKFVFLCVPLSDSAQIFATGANVHWYPIDIRRKYCRTTQDLTVKITGNSAPNTNDLIIVEDPVQLVPDPPGVHRFSHELLEILPLR